LFFLFKTLFDMKDRLNHLIATEGLTPSEFADKLGINRPTVSHVLSGRNNPGYDFIRTILLSFPRLNAEWFLLGKGDMYKHPTVNHPKDLFSLPKQEPPPSYPTPSLNTPPVPPHTAIPANEKKSPPPPILPSSRYAKDIERIVVFYVDKSFSAYQPEETRKTDLNDAK
jgi:transcriptional regulator with XRE-family HTH domain